MAGTKRVYAVPMAVTNKRRKFTKSRRSRRRYGRRANGKFSKDRTMVSHGQLGGGLAFKSRKTSRSAYRRRLWNESTGQEHFRSVASYSFIASSPANSALAGLSSRVALNPNFSTVGDGAQFPVLPTTVFARDLIIRGGKVTLSSQNPSLSRENVVVRVWLVRTIGVGAIPPAGNVPAEWDPSIDANFVSRFRVLRNWKFTLEEGQAFTIEHRLSTRVWDFGHSATEFVMSWMISVQSLLGSVILLPMISGHSVSFTGDSIV